MHIILSFYEHLLSFTLLLSLLYSCLSLSFVYAYLVSLGYNTLSVCPLTQ